MLFRGQIHAGHGWEAFWVTASTMALRWSIMTGGRGEGEGMAW